MDIHQKLKHLMDERGWSEYKLSKECGLSESTLANIFKRNTTPSISTLEAICKAFGISLAQFFAEGDFIELTPELRDLFNSWLSLTAEQKSAVNHMIKAFKSDRI